MSKKRNCYNCTYLMHYEKERPESFSPEGYYCDGREYKSNMAEHHHNRQLTSKSYLDKAKKCCRLKT